MAMPFTPSGPPLGLPVPSPDQQAGPLTPPTALGQAPVAPTPDPQTLLAMLPQLGLTPPSPTTPGADPLAQAVAGNGPPLPDNSGRTDHRMAMATSQPDAAMPVAPDVSRPQLQGVQDRTKDLLTAPTAADFTERALGQQDPRKQIAAGAVLALVAQHVVNDDPNDLDPTGTQGAAWDVSRADYAFRNNLVGSTADGSRFGSLYGRFVSDPQRLKPEDAAALANMIVQLGQATKGLTTPDLTDGGMRVARVDFVPGQAVLRMQGDEHVAGLARQVVAGTPPVPAAALAKLTDKPAFLHTADGMAVATSATPPADDAVRQLRVLQPLPVGGATRWVPRAPIVRSDTANTLASELQTAGSTVEIHHVPTGPHPATQPGQTMVVTVPSGKGADEARRVIEDNQLDRSAATDMLGVEERTAARDGEPLSRGVRQLAVTLPDTFTAKQAKALAGGLVVAGATSPVLYTHGTPDGFTPVTEAHYTGPADQIVIHRSVAPLDAAAQHAYVAWMLPNDASKLGDVAHNLNSSRPSVFDTGPTRQQDNSFVANNELQLHVAQPDPNAALEVPNRWWDTTVGGKPTRSFVLDHPAAGVPSVGLGTTPDDARSAQPPSPTAVEGDVASGKVVTELRVPMGDSGKPNLDALHDAVRTLTRYGLTVNPNQVRILGQDGQRYTMTGEPQ